MSLINSLNGVYDTEKKQLIYGMAPVPKPPTDENAAKDKTAPVPAGMSNEKPKGSSDIDEQETKDNNMLKAGNTANTNVAAVDDFITQSFREVQEQSAVDTASFHVASMNSCLEKAKSLPPLVELYPNIVLEGDLCIIFGQSGIGKTIFAMQVARDIAAKGKRVLYLDFEMSERQLALRYTTPNFPPTFFRAELQPDTLVGDVLKEIENVAMANLADVLFIDNITALGQSLDKGVEAGTLMASLNALKKEHNWTLIVLNHVPKRYSGSMPLSLEAIQGSAKLNQLVDDAIGLGLSQKDHSMVYVKQCKWRNGEINLGAEHVAVYERTKDGQGNLGFVFRDYGVERDLLAMNMQNAQDDDKARIISLHEQGYTQQQIADELVCSQSKVSRTIKALKQEI